MARIARHDLNGFDRFCAWNAILYPIFLFIGWWLFAEFAWYFILGVYMLRALKDADAYLPRFYSQEVAPHDGSAPTRDRVSVGTMV